MDVSVDTNILIHLYNSGYEEILFSTFKNVYVYEYIIENELKKVDLCVYKKVISHLEDNKIIILNDLDLIDRGIKELFYEYYREYIILFGGDKGEAYAIAMAGVIGCEAFVSDDTKDGGPHETLLKELIEEIIPFAYYELLYFKFLNGEISCEQFKNIFEDISFTMSRPPSFKSRTSAILRRFNPRFGSKRDILWINKFCNINKVNLKSKVHELYNFLNSLDLNIKNKP